MMILDFRMHSNGFILKFTMYLDVVVAEKRNKKH